MDKICRKCQIALDDDNWTPSRQRARNYICKPCGNTSQDKWRKNNKTKYNASHAKYMKKKKMDDEYRLKYNEYHRNYHANKKITKILEEE
ncbi:MAG: hypothetical protein WCH62_04080 [Candidatus Omnitrophota bacterium]